MTSFLVELWIVAIFEETIKVNSTFVSFAYGNVHR